MTCTPEYCGPGKRCLAIIYDCLILLSVFFFSTLLIIPFLHGKAIESNNIVYQFYLLLITYFYFCWHWVNGGQTLGMRSWHIKVTTKADTNLRWRYASLRFAGSILSCLLIGTGFIWAMFDKHYMALHDRLSGTKLIVTKANNFVSTGR